MFLIVSHKHFDKFKAVIALFATQGTHHFNLAHFFWFLLILSNFLTDLYAHREKM